MLNEPPRTLWCDATACTRLRLIDVPCKITSSVPCPGRSHGFSLIETLVVIAIIAIMMSMLLTVLHTAIKTVQSFR